MTSSNQRFFKCKILKNWQENVHVGLENDWSGSFVLFYGWNNEDVRGVFLYSNPLGSYEQSKFSRLVAKLKIAHNFPMDLNREKPHVHLHDFIHRVRQNCQTNHFQILHERFLVSFSKFWIWKTVDLMMSHDFCQRISWKIAKGKVWAKFHIRTEFRRCINIGFHKTPN